MKVMQTLRDKVFSQIHSGNLIYNTCWEDPACDRALLNINPQSKMVMITSAGCNALDYLLDSPQAIHAIDVNKRQNALLELKKAMFKTMDHTSLFEVFGKGATPHFKVWLHDVLQNAMPAYAYKYWAQNSHYFSTMGLRKRFYYHGTSGVIAWFFKQYLSSRPALKQKVYALFDAPTLEAQTTLYMAIEPKLFSPFVQWLCSQHFVLALAGVPRAQRNLIQQNYVGGVAQFMLDSLRKVFVTQPTRNNYFWYLYIFGQYTTTCCPNYLKAEHFDTLRDGVENLHTHTTTISNFLIENPDTYTQYILLDHQDWLAHHAVDALIEEWQLILKNSQPGTQILLRSAATTVNFLPQFVLDAVHFDTDKAQKYHPLDRVGTYGSVYIGTVI